jgi:hypothetical protein
MCFKSRLGRKVTKTVKLRGKFKTAESSWVEEKHRVGNSGHGTTFDVTKTQRNKNLTVNKNKKIKKDIRTLHQRLVGQRGKNELDPDTDVINVDPQFRIFSSLIIANVIA